MITQQRINKQGINAELSYRISMVGGGEREEVD
jgi:hypothetical protein